MTTLLPRRNLLIGGAALAAASTLGTAPLTSAAEVSVSGPRHLRGTVHRWARDTWASLVAMTDEGTGLTADNVTGPLRHPERSGYTSPTNIGGYLWSTVVARELKLISHHECTRRLGQTLHTLSRMDYHDPSGQFFNWYDEKTAEKLTQWPVDQSVVNPFLSSVDNGWLAAALIVVSNADPAVARTARHLLNRMNFAAYYDADAAPAKGAGLLRGGFWLADPPKDAVRGNYLGTGPDVYYTEFHYDTTVSETRIASYIGIARGQIPARHYFATNRTFPSTCDWNWQEQQPVGVTRTYLGTDVYEGAYTYRGMHLVPGWGGSMFEALMPNVFVPEEHWAPRSWGVNHPLTVRAHREHGLDDAKYGFWGFSPASDPGVQNGYDTWGVDAIGLNPDGYYSDLERTNLELAFGDCRLALNPTPHYGDGVVTPHALFLAMHHEPRQAFSNLVKIERELGAYGQGGFYDAVAVGSGKIAKRYLSLDQSMILGSIGNVFAGDVIRRHFAVGAIRRRIKPLIGMEEFGAGLV